MASCFGSSIKFGLGRRSANMVSGFLSRTTSQFMRKAIYFGFLFFLAASCSNQQTLDPTQIVADQQVPPNEEIEAPATQDGSPPVELTQPGESLVTYVSSDSIGDIAVKINLPETARYEEGAGVVVNIATYFTPIKGFYEDLDVTPLGLIHISYLWPGTSDPSGAESEGTFDYGGPVSIMALRDVLRFATGEIPDRDGHFLNELIAITPLTDNVGLYAFSHPGIAAVNVLALYGDQLPGVKYFVGRENPTIDILSAVEIGYFDENNVPVLNPLYQFPDSYRPSRFIIDYSSARWDPDYSEGNPRFKGRPYFDLNQNELLDAGDHVLGSRIPVMSGKRFYSTALTRALRENGALAPEDWPEDLATPEETAQIWPFHNSVDRYPELAVKTPELKVMLVFAAREHVQPALDKPNIHQAFDGFYRAAGLWVRLNPDNEYVEWIAAHFEGAYNEHPANSEPDDWMDATPWGYGNLPGGSILIPLAAVSEMADRAYVENWEEDLDTILVDIAAPLIRQE